MSRYAARALVRDRENHHAGAITVLGPVLVGPEAAHLIGIPYWRWDDTTGRLTQVHPQAPR